MISRERRAWVSRRRRRDLPRTAGLGELRTVAAMIRAADGGVNKRQPVNLTVKSCPPRMVAVISPRTAGLKDAAIPPNSHADLQWAMAGIRAATSQPRDQQTGTKKKRLLKCKTKRGQWAPLTVRSGLLSRCTQREEQGTWRRGVNSNNSL